MIQPLPRRSDIPNPMDVATLDLGYRTDYTWRVTSDCGVVKVYSSRDGCMLALNATTARRLAGELHDALVQAADATDIRSFGYVVDKDGRRVF